MQHPWHWRPLPVFVLGTVALLYIFVLVSVWRETIWTVLASLPPVVVIAVVQYRLTAIALGKR